MPHGSGSSTTASSSFVGLSRCVLSLQRGLVQGLHSESRLSVEIARHDSDVFLGVSMFLYIFSMSSVFPEWGKYTLVSSIFAFDRT